jgi:hypothetical protein
MPTTHIHHPTTTPAVRKARHALWAAPLLALSLLAACGTDTEVADAVDRTSGTEHRDASAAEAARYVELQLDRAAEARS